MINVIYYYRVDMVSRLIMVSRLFMASCLCLLGNQLKYTKWLAEKQKIIFEHCIQFGINYNLIDIVFPSSYRELVENKIRSFTEYTPEFTIRISSHSSMVRI
jgi:hypothetical protein